MKVMTQMGLLEINPVSDLTHWVELDDRFYDIGDKSVCISEQNAEKLEELAGVEITGTRGKIKTKKEATT